MAGEEEALPEQTPLLQAAITHHTMFENYVKGGFTEAQAIVLIANIIATQFDQNGNRKCPNCGHTF